MSLVYTTDGDGPTGVLRAIGTDTGIMVRELAISSTCRAPALNPVNSFLAIPTDKNILIVNTASLEVSSSIDVAGVDAASFSRDGVYLAAGNGWWVRLLLVGGDYSLVSEGKARHLDHHDSLFSLHFSPSSRYIVSGSHHADAVVWNVPAMDAHRVLHVDAAKSLSTVLFRSDYTVLTGSENTINVWDVDSGTRTKKLKDHSGVIHALALTPNEALFASGSSDKTVKLFDATLYACIGTFKCPSSVRTLVFANNDTLIVGVSKGEMLAIDIKTLTVVTKYPKHVDPRGVAATH